MNLNQIEKQIAELQKQFRKEIYKSADAAGGFSELSIKLGYPENFIKNVIKRNSFSALWRVVKKIYNAKSAGDEEKINRR